MVKNVPAVWKTQVQFLGQEDLQEENEWPPTPIFLPQEFHGQKNLAGYSPLGRRELDMTEQLTNTQVCVCICVCSYCCLVTTKLFPTLCNPMDCSPPGCSVHKISHARILVWVAIFFFRGSF